MDGRTLHNGMAMGFNVVIITHDWRAQYEVMVSVTACACQVD